MMEQKLFTVDMLLGLYQPAIRVPLHLSPDGQKLSITRQSCRRENEPSGDYRHTATGIPKELAGSQVLVLDTTTGTVEEPFPNGATSWCAQWSPDGTRLAAYVQHEGQACLGVWDRASGEHLLYPHCPIKSSFGFEVPRWTPDGQMLIVKLLTMRQENVVTTDEKTRQQTGPATVFSFNPTTEHEHEQVTLPGWADGYSCDLARIDIITGVVERLVENWNLIGWKVAPNARSVAVLRHVEYHEKLQQIYFDLAVISLEDGTSRVLARRIPQDFGICFNWSPDSRFIAYTTDERGVRKRLFVVATNGSSEPLELSSATEELQLAHEDVAAPRWSRDGQHIYCLAWRGFWIFAVDGSSRRYVTTTIDRTIIDWIQPPTTATLWEPQPNTLLYLTRNQHTKETGLTFLNMESGEGTTFAEFPQRPGWSSFEMEVSADRVTLYLLLEGTDHPAEVWQCCDGYQNARRLCSLNGQLTNVALGTTRLLSYRTLDGERRQAVLLLPANYQEGETVPLVVEVYGGSTSSNYLHRFGVSDDIINGQVLASHGYAVLYPDQPMKGRDPMQQLPGLVIPAINHLIDLGIADPKRIGLMGHSYGGYCTLALLAQSGIFAAAVASAGIYNLVYTYLTMNEDGTPGWIGWCETGQGRMGGSLWDKRATYIENSPGFYLDRVQTPLLLTCGTLDYGAPAEAEAIFTGLRGLGKKVELRQYEGEGHWPGTWSERSYRDLCERLLSWFDEHLKR